MMRWLSALGLLAAGTALLAADDKKAANDKKSAKIQVVSLAIYKAPPPKPGTFMMRANSTNMEVMVSLPDHYITGLDAKASKLDSFTDDKDNVLYKKGGGFFGTTTPWLPEYGIRFDPDGESVTVMVHGTNPPGKGAEKILLKGSLNVKCGSDEKATDPKGMTMKPKEEADVGPFKVRVSQFGGQIEVLSNDENIKKVEFFDNKGKAIPMGQPGRSRTAPEKGKSSYKYGYYLFNKLEKFSVKIHYFTKVETVKVPLDLRVGLGLE